MGTLIIISCSRRISTNLLHLTLFLLATTAILITAPHDAFKVSPPPWSSLNLADLTDEQIHEYCVSKQIQNHRPVPKSLETRQTISLDGQWDFRFDPQRKGFAQNWSSRPLRSIVTGNQTDLLYQMPVPSAFNSIPSLDEHHNYIGWFWYQRTFSLNNHHHQQVLIHFESVNYLALVWLQPLREEQDSPGGAKLMGSHVGGHLPFVINMTDLIDNEAQFGKLRMHFRLTVAVSNKLDDNTIPSGRMEDLSKQVGHHYEVFRPDFDFFHYAGILGPVRLVELAPLYLARVERLLKMHGRRYDYIIWLEICLGGDLSRIPESDGSGSGVKLRARLHKLDETHLTIVENVKPIINSVVCHQMHLEPPSSDSVQDWKLANGNPNHLSALYSINVELLLFGDDSRSGHLVDLYELRVAFKPELALLNEGDERPDQLQGFGLHQEQLFSGRTMSLPAIMKDIYLLKQMGTNLIRTSHYPYSSDFLDACDQHGLLVVAECQAVGLNSFSDEKLALHKQLLKEMMERDNHHPSIMMWSIANEPSSQRQAARGYFERLVEFARLNLAKYTTDADRSLTAAIAQSARADLIGDLLDVVMVNRYMGWYEATGVLGSIRPSLFEGLCDWSERLPGKPLLVSEFGAEALVGLHHHDLWSPSSSSSLIGGQIYSEEYQRDLLVEHEKLFNELWLTNNNLNCSKKINFIGSMIWNFADFSTDVSLTRIGNLNRKGIFTRAREPKLAAEVIRKIYLERIRANEQQHLLFRARDGAKI